MLKHFSKVNLEDLDFKEVDKEIEADEAIQATTTAPEENTLEGNDCEPEDASIDSDGGDKATV